MSMSPTGAALARSSTSTSLPGWLVSGATWKPWPNPSSQWPFVVTSTSPPTTGTSGIRPPSYGSTHVTPEERKALADLESWGLVDAFRERWPEDRLYTYWDYRAGDFHEHRGMRIDLVLVTRALAEKVSWALVDRNARKGKLPSDHAPLFIDVQT